MFLLLLHLMLVCPVNGAIHPSVGLNSSWIFPTAGPILKLRDRLVSFDTGTLTVLSPNAPLDMFVGFPYEPIWWPRTRQTLTKNSTLRLQHDGNLVLRYVDGTIAWETSTAGRGVSTLELQSSGNLVLLTRNKSIIWQSFDSPTNILMMNQTLKVGSRLESQVSLNDFTSTGNFYLQVEASSVYLYARTTKDSKDLKYGSSNVLDYTGYTGFFYKLTSKGDFLNYEEGDFLNYEESFFGLGIFNGGPAAVCGQYGFSTDVGQCSCFFDGFFTFVNQSSPSDGCTLQEPLACDDSPQLVAYPGVSNILAEFNREEFPTASLDQCKSWCLRNSTQKASQDDLVTTFFKVGQNTKLNIVEKRKRWPVLLILSIIGAASVVFVAISFSCSKLAPAI